MGRWGDGVTGRRATTGHPLQVGRRVGRATPGGVGRPGLGGELDPAVADDIAVAFGQAVSHIQCGVATCYIALPPEYMPRADLLGQAAALEEMAAQGNLDPAVVEQARDALARDMEWLAAFQAGQVPGELQETEADATSIEAARILVELLLGE